MRSDTDSPAEVGPELASLAAETLVLVQELTSSSTDFDRAAWKRVLHPVFDVVDVGLRVWNAEQGVVRLGVAVHRNRGHSDVRLLRGTPNEIRVRLGELAADSAPLVATVEDLARGLAELQEMRPG